MITRISNASNANVARQQMCDITSSKDNVSNSKQTTQASGGSTVELGHSTSPARNQARRYYIDELGFYRYLDAEPKQNAAIASRNASSQAENQHGSKTAVNRGDCKQENLNKIIRLDLGISHFDKIDDYREWKRSWDEFMRIKLITQQPVTLNRELKLRVRSGIPHDYRCKVWTALIRMRTKSIRAQFGEDIYQAIVKDFVSKVEVPDYNDEGDHDNNDEDLNNNNNSQKKKNRRRGSSSAGGGTSYIVGSSRFYSATEIKPIDEADEQPAVGGQDENRRASFVGQRPLVGQEPVIDKCFKQIELDLLRTLPNNRHFEDPKSRGVHRVRRILRAYACFNQSVGYCQGMNRLAAMSLLVLPEEEAFWCLVAIIQCIMPRDYYLKPWLAQVDCCVLNDLLEKKMSKLHKHLANNDIQLTLFSWFFTIFVDGFRPELMLRIWDCFLLEGDKVLFRFALAILYIAQVELLKMNDFSSMSGHLSRLVAMEGLDVEHLFEAFNTMNPLSSGTIQSRREFHRNRMQPTMDD